LVAQVLPVFWVLLAIEKRVFRPKHRWGRDRYFVIANYVSLVLGEVAALAAVALETPDNRLLFLLTVIALLLSFAFVSSIALSD
jgi:hypothetical protein